MKIWTASRPANIALIKYMGKQHGQHAINPSLSYTLDHYQTTVTLRLAKTDAFVQPCQWPDQAQKRFINHLQYLKKSLGISTCFNITSDNNFDSDCGLASSASSFAALTDCFFKYIDDDYPHLSTDIHSIAYMSSQGSGSSCRSFFSPWSIWNDKRVEAIDLPYQDLTHILLLIDGQPKDVSSSEAHSRIKTSLLFESRANRAQRRLDDLIQAFRRQHWQDAREIVWAEFWDMHGLFHTARPPFSYFKANTTQCLHYLMESFFHDPDGPLVTMDAGCNIHLLFKQKDDSYLEQYRSQLEPYCQSIITSINGPLL